MASVAAVQEPLMVQVDQAHGAGSSASPENKRQSLFIRFLHHISRPVHPINSTEDELVTRYKIRGQVQGLEICPRAAQCAGKQHNTDTPWISAPEVQTQREFR